MGHVDELEWGGVAVGVVSNFFPAQKQFPADTVLLLVM